MKIGRMILPLFRRANSARGVTMIELLCVLGIIAILMGMYMPTILRVYKRIRSFLGEM